MKGKKRLLFFTFLGVILAVTILFLGVYSTELLQDKDWKSGKVIIGEHILTLPCSMGEFERRFNPEIIFNKDSLDIRSVKIDSYDFDIKVSDGEVIGILVSVDLDNEMSREVLNDILFPGNVSVGTDFNDINKRYGSVPLNVFKKGCFVNSVKGHECSKYSNNKWEIEIYSIDKKISSIRYFYIG